MKTTVTLVFLLSLANALAETSPNCPNEEGYFYTNNRNRNPQAGGFVSNLAYVDDTTDLVFVGPESAICGSSNISGRAKIYGKAVVRSAEIKDNAQVYDNAVVENGAKVSGAAKVSGNAVVRGSVSIEGEGFVAGNAEVSNESEDFLAVVAENARVTGDALVSENAQVRGKAKVQGKAIIKGEAVIEGNATIGGCASINTGVINTGTNAPAGDCSRVLTGSNFPESRHPYANSLNETVIYQLPGYVMLEVTFDNRTDFEAGRDLLTINGGQYSASALAGQTMRFSGDKLTINFTSDHSNNAWGYKIVDIKGVDQILLNEERRIREERQRQRALELAAKRSQAEALRQQLSNLFDGYVKSFTKSAEDEFRSYVETSSNTWSTTPHHPCKVIFSVNQTVSQVRPRSVEVNTLTRIEVNLKNYSHIEFHRYGVRNPLGGSTISELAHDGLRLVFNQQLVSEVKKHFYIEDRESRSGPEYFNVPGVDLPAREGYQASNNSYLVPVLSQLQQVCSDPEI